MLDVKIEKGKYAAIHVSGTIEEVANDVLNIVSALYAQMHQQADVESIIFRTYLMTALNDPNSQVWDGRLPEGSIAMGVHKKVKREDGKK